MYRNVSRETEERLNAYLALLLKWQEKINLISPNTIKDAWDRHFEDSIQIEPLLPVYAKTLYDLGSGAGFPGLVLAMMRPDISITLIESDTKKCAFLAAVSRETSVAAIITNTRIEVAADTLPPPDVITARALAPLESLLSYCHPWIKNNPKITLIFPKGANASDEIQAAKRARWTFDLAEASSKTDPKSRILVLSNMAKNLA